MLVIEMLSEDQRATETPQWSGIAEALLRVSTGESKSLLLEAPGEAWLAASCAVGHGLQVMAIEEGEQAELVLTRRGVSAQLIPVVLGGVPQQEPASSLVPYSLAVEAARFFSETGKRAPSLFWQDPFELERTGVGA